MAKIEIFFFLNNLTWSKHLKYEFSVLRAKACKILNKQKPILFWETSNEMNNRMHCYMCLYYHC